jgi:hypothetical protein
MTLRKTAVFLENQKMDNVQKKKKEGKKIVSVSHTPFFESFIVALSLV